MRRGICCSGTRSLSSGTRVEPGELNVLHIGWDVELGFMFLDGGDLTFHGPTWDRLTVTPQSS